jgi:hypothetical protein
MAGARAIEHLVLCPWAQNVTCVPPRAESAAILMGRGGLAPLREAR